jgi:hypothetical protein
MPAASGVFKQLSYKAESSYGSAPTAADFIPLRRVTSDISVVKDTYTSNEIRTDQQMQDMRHGVRRVQGTIAGEVAPGAYADFMAAALRRDFGALSNLTSLSLTIGGTAPAYTVGGITNLLTTSGLKAGDVFRITAGTGLNADVLNKNLLIVSASGTTATVRVLNGSTMTLGSGTACTIAIPGKKTYAPTTGHTNKSFAIEHWFADMSPTQRELYLGCQPTTLDIELPATGLATISMGFVGRTVETATTRFATSFAAANSKGLLAAVNGILAFGGTPAAVITGATINVQSNRTGDPVVGSNFVPTMFPGRIMASGQFTAYFEDVTLRDAFLNETDTSAIIALSADNSATADFLTLTMPRIKVNGHTLSDGEGGLVATIPFQALLPTTGGSTFQNELTTISIHDSAA